MAAGSPPGLLPLNRFALLIVLSSMVWKGAASAPPISYTNPTLSTEQCNVEDMNSYSGDDGGLIWFSPMYNKVYYEGDQNIVRYSAGSHLTYEASFNFHLESVHADPVSGQIYQLMSGSDPLTSTSTFTAVKCLGADLVETSTVQLSSSLTLSNPYSVYIGDQALIVRDNQGDWQLVSLACVGTLGVASLGSGQAPPVYMCERQRQGGMLEFDGVSYYIYYARNDGTVWRRIINGPAKDQEEPLVSTQLRDICSLSFDYGSSRWYFHAEGLQYNSISYVESLASCPANFLATASATVTSTLSTATTKTSSSTTMSPTATTTSSTTSTLLTTTITSSSSITSSTSSITSSTATSTSTTSISTSLTSSSSITSTTSSITSSTATSTTSISTSLTSSSSITSTTSTTSTATSTASTATSTTSISTSLTLTSSTSLVTHTSSTSVTPTSSSTSRTFTTITLSTHTASTHTSSSTTSFTSTSFTHSQTTVTIISSTATSKSSTSSLSHSSTTTASVTRSSTSISHTISSSSSATVTGTTRTSTASSTTVTGLAELAAQAAVAVAQQELLALQEAEVAAVASLFNSINASSATAATSVPQVTQSVGNVTVTVALLTPAAAAGDGPVKLTADPFPTTKADVGKTQPTVAVSPSTLRQILGSSPQGVVLSMSASESNELGDSLSTAEAAVADSKGVDGKGGRVVKKLLVAPISINIKDLNGNLIHITFEEPLNISMGANASGAFECSFWNDTLKAWSTEGVSAVDSLDGSIVCATTHLSIFGAFDISDIASAITCLSLDMFNNLDKLAGGAWVLHVGAISFFVALLSQLALVSLGVLRDRQTAQSRHYHDFFVHEEHEHELFNLRGMIAAVFNIQQFRLGKAKVYSARKNLSSMIMLQVMGVVIGYKAGLHGKDLHILRTLQRQKRPFYVQMASNRVQEGLTFIRSQGKLEFDRFREQGVFQRSWLIFKGVQVFSQVSGRFSVFMTSQTIAELFALKFLLSVAFSAFFYYSQSAAEDLPPEDPCAPQEYGVIMNFLRALLITFVCSVPSSIIMYVFQGLAIRKFSHQHVDDRQKAWRVRRWAIVDTCSVVARNGLMIFLAFFVCLILSSISAADHTMWAYSFLYSFVQQYVTISVATAVGLSLATMVAERISTEAVADVRENLEHWADLPEEHPEPTELVDAEAPQKQASQFVLDVADPLASQCDDLAESDGNPVVKPSDDKPLVNAAAGDTNDKPSDGKHVIKASDSSRTTRQRAPQAIPIPLTKGKSFVRTTMLAQEAQESGQSAKHTGSNKVDSQTPSLDQLIATWERDPPTTQESRFSFNLVSQESIDEPRGSQSIALPYEEEIFASLGLALQVESTGRPSTAMTHEEESLVSRNSVTQAGITYEEESFASRTSVPQSKRRGSPSTAVPYEEAYSISRTSVPQVGPPRGSPSTAMPYEEEDIVGSRTSVPDGDSSSAVILLYALENLVLRSSASHVEPRRNSAATVLHQEEAEPYEEEPWDPLGNRYDEDVQDAVMLSLSPRLHLWKASQPSI